MKTLAIIAAFIATLPFSLAAGFAFAVTMICTVATVAAGLAGYGWTLDLYAHAFEVFFRLQA